MPPSSPVIDDPLVSEEWDEMITAACRGEGVATVFQPIVDTTRGSVVGYEALTRFSGYVESSPEIWFRAARANGRIEELEVMALRRALDARPTLPSNCFLTLNVSPDLLTSAAVREVWQDEGDLSGVVVELTEQSQIESYEALEPDLDKLRGAGGLIAVDDTGAGYAGLQHLLALRPSVIKLDRALVEDVDRDGAKRALIEMIGTFADRVDAWVLAEGVERVDELDALADLGVPLVQGYLLARPASDWATIDQDLALRLAVRSVPEQIDSIRDLIESVPTATSIADAAVAFTADPRLRSVVLVDVYRRPMSVIDYDSGPIGLSTPGLRINVDTSLSAAATRAMTRESGNRFEPLMVTDNGGRFLGIVRLERLIQALCDND